MLLSNNQRFHSSGSRTRDRAVISMLKGVLPTYLTYSRSECSSRVKPRPLSRNWQSKIYARLSPSMPPHSPLWGPSTCPLQQPQVARAGLLSVGIRLVQL